MNHIRPANRVTPDLRDWEALERRDTAFNTLAHSVDMRRIETQKGRYNIPNVGLFLWRLDAFSLTQLAGVSHRRRALPVQPARQRHAVVHPAARAKPISRHLAEPINVPEPISRRVLHTLSRPLLRRSSLSLFVEADDVDTGIDNIHICNLSDDGASWAHLPVSERFPSIRCSAASPFRRAAAAGKRARDFSLRVQHGHGRRRVRAAPDVSLIAAAPTDSDAGPEPAERARLGAPAAASSRSATAGATRRPWRLTVDAQTQDGTARRQRTSPDARFWAAI